MSFSQIIIGEASAVAVGFKPVVEVDLIQVGGDDFFAEFVRFNAQERYAQSCERGDQRLGDLVRVRGAVFVARFHLAQSGGDDQQAVGKRAHAPQARNKDGTFHYTLSGGAIRKCVSIICVMSIGSTLSQIFDKEPIIVPIAIMIGIRTNIYSYYIIRHHIQIEVFRS